MTHTVKSDTTAYITDIHNKIWASVRPVTQGASLYDLFISPTAGPNHHIQVSFDELEAVSDMINTVLTGVSNG
jgi:hypothetical protein